MTITQSIDALTAAPDPATMTPTAFSAAAAAYVASQLALETQMNNWAGQANALASEVNENLVLSLLSTTSTSTTSLTIGSGAQTLTVQAGKGYAVGMDVKIASTADPSTYMVGTVTSYNTGTGELHVTTTTTAGSGTLTAWTVTFTNLVVLSAVGADLYLISQGVL